MSTNYLLLPLELHCLVAFSNQQDTTIYYPPEWKMDKKGQGLQPYHPYNSQSLVSYSITNGQEFKTGSV
jgi:hypothetical protein